MSIQEVVVEGYDNFWKTVREKEAEATSQKLPLIVIIKSTNKADGTIDIMLTDKLNGMKVNGIIVKGKVGTLEEWLKDDNKFKTDPVLRLASVPSAFRWKDGKPLKRLETPAILNPEKFKALFTD